VGPFDTQTACDGAFADPAKFNARVKLFWMGAGTAEAQLHENIDGAVDALRKSGVRPEVLRVARNGHTSGRPGDAI